MKRLSRENMLAVGVVLAVAVFLLLCFLRKRGSKEALAPGVLSASSLGFTERVACNDCINTICSGFTRAAGGTQDEYNKCIMLQCLTCPSGTTGPLP